MGILIISGGQTGADKAGLMAAKKIGFATGGIAPKGYKTELGVDLELKTIYQLEESTNSNYAKRTQLNVQKADCTVVFSENCNSKGTQLTMASCIQYNKPFLLVAPSNTNAISLVTSFLSTQLTYADGIINIAGNRESKAPGLQKEVYNILVEVFAALKKYSITLPIDYKGAI